MLKQGICITDIDFERAFSRQILQSGVAVVYSAELDITRRTRVAVAYTAQFGSIDLKEFALQAKSEIEDTVAYLQKVAFLRSGKGRKGILKQ